MGWRNAAKVIEQKTNLKRLDGSSIAMDFLGWFITLWNFGMCFSQVIWLAVGAISTWWGIGNEVVEVTEVDASGTIRW